MKTNKTFYAVVLTQMSRYEVVPFTADTKDNNLTTRPYALIAAFRTQDSKEKAHELKESLEGANPNQL